MIEKNVTILNRLGLHARAAAKVVRTASGFRSKIRLRRIESDAEIDAKSILNILSLAAAKGTVLRLTAEGDDEAEAIETLEMLINEKFGEEV